MLKRLASGKPLKRIPGPTWNAFCDAAEEVLGRREGDAFGLPPFYYLAVRAVNLSTGARPQFGCVGLGDPLTTPTVSLERFRTEAAIKGYKPDAATYRFKWGLAVTELVEKAVGEVAVAGVLPCKITVGHASHPFVTLPDTAADLPISGWFGGAKILWKESGTGDKWAIVELGGFWQHTILGKAGSAIAKGATGSVSVWPGSGSSDSGSTIDAVARGVAIVANKYVSLVWPTGSDKAVVAPFECP